jgi:hypothetical protein
MRSKKGAAGKPEEERWRGIYQLIFPDAEEKEMAMPCESSGRAAFVIVVFANAGSDVSVKGMEGRHKDQIRLPAPYQALENFSRELLRILPIRLNAAFASRSEDTRLTAMWNDFANGQLHDVLRGVIAEMSSSASSLPLAEMSNKEASGGGERCTENRHSYPNVRFDVSAIELVAMLDKRLLELISHRIALFGRHSNPSPNR